jgi:hypothetical protein
MVVSVFGQHYGSRYFVSDDLIPVDWLAVTLPDILPYVFGVSSDGVDEPLAVVIERSLHGVSNSSMFMMKKPTSTP